MAPVAATLKWNLLFALRYFRVKHYTNTISRTLRKYGFDKVVRMNIEQLSDLVAFIANNIGSAPKPIQHNLARSVAKYQELRTRMHQHYNWCVSRELISEATKKRFSRFDKDLKHIVQVGCELRVAYGYVDVIGLKEGTAVLPQVNTERIPTYVWVFCVYFVLLFIAAFIYGYATLNNYGFGPQGSYGVAALIVAGLSLLVLTRILTGLDYWREVQEEY